MLCFDATEPSNGNSDRRSYGNNRYIYSNLRQWLNSPAAAGQWYTAQHSADQTPDSSHVWSGYNAYSGIAGFLNAFTANERAALLNTTITVGKSSTDGGGTETCTDKIFPLSCTEVGLSGDHVCGSSWRSSTKRATAPTPRWPRCSRRCSASSNCDVENEQSGRAHHGRGLSISRKDRDPSRQRSERNKKDIMGRLIIAEKHSVAQAIAAALGGGKAEDGWIGCGADAVTWAQGHLVDLLTPDEYQDRGWDKWSMDALPLDPTGGWKWKVNRQRGADRQYRVVAGLLKSDAYDVLVNACDPDREGESIFHRIVSYAGTRKPMLRLWVASLEEDAIRDALDSMRSEDEYRGLAEAADIRAKADWLIGMNASRAYTLVYHRRMSVGRVQTPTLAMVADRDRQIAHHVEKPFWKVVVPMGGWTLTGERLDDRTDAEALKSIVDAPDFTFQVSPCSAGPCMSVRRACTT